MNDAIIEITRPEQDAFDAASDIIDEVGFATVASIAERIGKAEGGTGNVMRGQAHGYRRPIDELLSRYGIVRAKKGRTTIFLAAE